MARAAVVTIIRPPVRAGAPISPVIPPTPLPRKVKRKQTPAPTPITAATPVASLPTASPDDDALPAVLQTKLLFSIADAARLLSLSRSKVYALVRDGRLRHVDIDTAMRITAQDLAAFIRGLQAAS